MRRVSLAGKVGGNSIGVRVLTPCRGQWGAPKGSRGKSMVRLVLWEDVLGHTVGGGSRELAWR